MLGLKEKVEVHRDLDHLVRVGILEVGLSFPLDRLRDLPSFVEAFVVHDQDPLDYRDLDPSLEEVHAWVHKLAARYFPWVRCFPLVLVVGRQVQVDTAYDFPFQH